MRRLSAGHSHSLALAGVFVAAAALLGAEVRFYDALPHTLNPLFARTGADWRVSELMFDALVERSPINQALHSDLLVTDAQGRIVVETPLETSIQVFVRDDVMWQDGVKLEPEDVCFTIDALLDEQTASPLGSQVRLDIERCLVVAGQRSVGITFRRTFTEPLARLDIPILPRHRFAPGAIHPRHDFSSHPIGTGPMIGTRGRASVTFTPSPYATRSPGFDRLTIAPGMDPFIEARHLIAGDVHGIMNVPLAVRADIEASGVATFTSHSTRSFLFIAVNTQQGALSDARVRAALDLSIDRAILREVTVGVAADNPGSELITGPFMPSSPYYDRSIPVVEHRDLERAKALMIEAGASWAGGRWVWQGQPVVLKIGMDVGVDAHATELLRQLGNQLQEAGFSSTLERLSRDTWTKEALTGKLTDHSLLVGRWSLLGGQGDPSALFHTRTPDGRGAMNLFDYHDSAVDALLERIDTARTDGEVRDAYRTLHRTLAAERPYLYLWKVDEVSAWRNEVHTQISPEGYFARIDGWSLTAP